MIFFGLQDVKVSALALLKMVMHARSGGNIEVMGLLLGKVDANVMVVFQKAAYSIYVYSSVLNIKPGSLIVII